MLPEIGMTELLVIAIVALIVVGPKDLPVLLRRFGEFMAKLRGMASEFRASFDEMARQSELDELRKEVEAMRRGQWADLSITDQAMRETVGDIEQSLSDVGVQLHPPMSYQYAETEPPPPQEPPPVEALAKKPARKPRAGKPKAAAKAAEAPGKTVKAPAKKTAAAPRKRREKPIVEGGA